MTDPRTEADRIKNRLRACENVESVAKVVEEEHKAFRALADAGGEARIYAIQISNLKQWKLDRLAKEAEQ